MWRAIFPLYYIAAEVNFNCVLFAEEYCAFQFQEFHFYLEEERGNQIALVLLCSSPAILYPSMCH